MAAERKIIDVEDNLDLAALARIVSDSGEEVVVRERGRKVAVVRPFTLMDRTSEDFTEEDRKAFLETAGSWKGLLDDDLLRVLRNRHGTDNTPLSVEDLSEEEREERRQRILALAGSLKGLIPDDFVEKNYRIRSGEDSID